MRAQVGEPETHPYSNDEVRQRYLITADIMALLTNYRSQPEAAVENHYLNTRKRSKANLFAIRLTAQLVLTGHTIEITE